MFVRACACALLVGLAGVAGAQTQPAPVKQQPNVPQLTPAQRAALQKQNQVLVRYAASIAEAVDAGKSAQVWDTASAVAKKATGRDAFVKTTETERDKLGKVMSRKLEAITRVESKGGKLPAGFYVNVNFVTQFAEQAKPVRELVSFHLDSDKTWRMSGYKLYATN